MQRNKILLVGLLIFLFGFYSVSSEAQVIFEAEDAYISNGKIDTKHPGFTGDGFADTENELGVYIEWTFNSLKEITDSIKFRYALGKDEHRTMQVYVNDVLIDTIDFDNTLEFTNYVCKYTTGTLVVGSNKVKLVSINAEGAPNLDHMAVKLDTNIFFKINTSIEGTGNIDISPVADSFLYGTRVKVLASTESGNIFNNWTGNFSGSLNPLSFTVDQDYNLGAKFLNVLKAFPGADGFAGNITGGRGGLVFEVTNLNDSGEGSLRNAINQSVRRTIVFRVGGTIELKSRLSISHGDLTIAGQTAPGGGITLSGYTLTVDADNVIIRYIRSRLGDVNDIEDDAMNGRNNSNVLIDHCTMSWSVDEAASFYDNTKFTMQYCLISESLYNSVHDKGQHGYGGIWGGKGATFHHNLIAHHTSRNPRFCGSRYSNQPDLELVDYRNNVIFNWGSNSVYGAEGGNYNIVNNYYKSGPATSSGVKTRIIAPNADNGDNDQPSGVWGMFYVNGNHVHNYDNFSENNWAGVNATISDKNLIKSEVEFDVDSVTTHSAEIAFEHVMAQSGACIPRRDAIDQRIVQETMTGIPTYGASYGAGEGIIDTPSDVGGYPSLEEGTPPVDTDHDGMPDAWETANNLNPDDPQDRNGDADTDGYTNLEEYLNSLVEQYTYIIRPLNFVISSSSETEVLLAWNDSIDNETGFLLERKVEGGEYELIAVIPANTESYTDEFTEPNNFTYRLRAFNDSDTSFYTHTAFVKLVSGVNDLALLPSNIEVYPIPFSEHISVKLNLLQAEYITITILSLSGVKISSIYEGVLSAGENYINWTNVNLNKGLYLLSIKSNQNSIVSKIAKL
ncbi:MAG: T9SS type A sorting domain-containing protein [Bacteroidales bacterium]|nr:T9SS type A sorting domain-containing protein [Bacteroidales bacterium]MBN2817519.1 T9SS type A sorting domain-containing protein [Bacteroidales bacterium]